MATINSGQRTKGNPAAHRMSNANLKARRARSWARGHRRKDQRRTEQEARHQANLVLWAKILDR